MGITLTPNELALAARTNHQDVNDLLLHVEKFRKEHYADTEKSAAFLDSVQNGQKPTTLVIGCIDSRVNPTDIFGIAPGEALVKRMVANLIPPYNESQPDSIQAALQFSVEILKVNRIIVLGHGRCGGVKALGEIVANPSALQNFSLLSNWVKIAAESIERVSKANQHLSPEKIAKKNEENTLLFSFRNLLTYPWVRAKVESGELSIFIMRYDLDTGFVHQLDPETGHFQVMAPKLRAKM